MVISRCVRIASASIICVSASPCINGTLVRRRMLPSNPGGLHNHRSDAAPGIQQDGVRAFVPCFRRWAWMATSGTVTPEGGEGPMGGFRIRAGRPLVQSTRAEGRGFPPARGQSPHRMNRRQAVTASTTTGNGGRQWQQVLRRATAAGSGDKYYDGQRRQAVAAGNSSSKIEPRRHRSSAGARKTGW